MLTEHEHRSPPLVLQITPDEREALQLLANGTATDDVATALGVSPSELESVLTGLFAAMGATSQTEAIAVALKRGLLTGAASL